MNYNSLMNKPTINYRELIGDNTVSEVGGITEEQFNSLLNTDLSSYYTKAQIDELFARSFVYREKSGSIVTFDCPTNTNGISEVTSEIVAVQSGTGDPSPTNIRPISGWSAVKEYNLDNTDKSPFFKGLTNGTFGYVDLGTLRWYKSGENNFYAQLLQHKVVAGDTPINGLTSNGMIFKQLGGSGNDEYIIITAIGYETYTPTQFKTAMNGVQLIYELATPTTPTITDEQFNSLLTAFGVSGTTYTTTLKDGQGNPMECYGGELSNVNGVQTLTVTHGYIASYNGETLPSTWISDRDVYAEGTTPTTGAEVVYALATSQQITQDTLSITSIAGINNIWCDSGDITVKALDIIIQG